MHSYLRLGPAFLLISSLLLGGCASTPDVITGTFNIDLRSQEKREAVYWPAPPEVPRYRYLGELFGEQNFDPDKGEDTTTYLFNLITGIFDKPKLMQLQRPTQVMTDENDRIYVVDAGLRSVVVFDSIIPVKEGDKKDKAPEADVEGQMLLWNFAREGIPFKQPVAVSEVWDGLVAVSDAELGFVTLLDDLGKPAVQIGQDVLQRPTGLAFDPVRGRLYVADTDANDIKLFDRSGALIDTIGSPGDQDGSFNAPTYLSFATGLGGGTLYVSDSLNSRIQILDADGNFLRKFGTRGNNVGHMMRPKGVAVGDDGISYVIESYFSHLLIYNQEDRFLLGINGSGLQGGEFRLPSGVWIDQHDRVFVADMFKGRVVVYQFLGGDGA